MIADIQCATCLQVMGTLSKPVILDDDILMYQQMMTCDGDHQNAVLPIIDYSDSDIVDDPGDDAS